MLDKKALMLKLREFFMKRYRDAVEYVILFGSISKGIATVTSDIDLAIKLVEERGGLAITLPELVCELASFLGIREDLIDIVLLKQGRDYSYSFLFNVFKDGELIYCRSKEKFMDDLIRACSLYVDHRIQLRKHRAIEKYIERYPEE